MTDEEIEKEAKEYAQGNFYSEQGFLYGYERGFAEGRKEKCLEQNNDGTIRPCEVMKENEELKAQLKNNPYVQLLQKEKSEMAEDFAKQIEKMKCCLNCKNQHIDYERRISCRLSQYYKNCDKWELAE